MRFRHLWRIARRDLRGSLAGFAIFFACTAMGVATIAAVGVLNASIEGALERDASALLGGDVSIEQPNVAISHEELAPLIPDGAQLSKAVRTNGIAYAGDRNIAVEIKAVDSAYPLFGVLAFEPSGSLSEHLTTGSVLVEPGVLARLDLAIGDMIKIGKAEVRISGVLTSEPDRIGGYIGLGPRVLMSWQTLASLEILVPGALARYNYRFALEDQSNVDDVVATLKEENPEAAWRGPKPKLGSAASGTVYRPACNLFDDGRAHRLGHWRARYWPFGSSLFG